MSVEVVEPLSRAIAHDVLNMSHQELKDQLDGISRATTQDEALTQGLSYEEIARLFLDAHTDALQVLQDAKREQILDMLLDHPAESFRGEFLQLQVLYEERSLSDERYDGTQIDEFCTQDHQRGTCDYLFSHRTLPSGHEVYEVRKVYTVFGKPDLISVTLKDDELVVTAQERVRGRTEYKEIDGENRERVLAQLFYDTIRASATQFERNDDERRQNNHQARGYLKSLRDNEYLQV